MEVKFDSLLSSLALNLLYTGKSEGGSLQEGVITNKYGRVLFSSIPLNILLLAVQDIMRAAVEPCVALINECNAGSVVSIEACLGAYIVCNYGEQVPYTLSGYNPYDMRLKCDVPPLCYDFGNIDKFLNRYET